jgi:hypothetical protein
MAIFKSVPSDFTTPLPLLDAALEPERAQWPTLPFAWRHLAAPPNDAVQPCIIETAWGAAVEGEMLDFDPVGACVKFRTAPGAAEALVPFGRIRRLVLTMPLLPAPKLADAPIERVPSAAQERDYRLQAKDGKPIAGRTAGYVVTDAGLYLFTPLDEERALQRVFVPRTAYTGCEFGPSAEEVAAERWIATPEALLEAIDRQQRMPVLKLGDALLNLGLITTRQLDRALAQQRGDTPLGQMLVEGGVISKADLDTALAHKMGYPLVDLTRFPFDLDTVRKLPLKLATQSMALPLMRHQERMIVAVDRPQRIEKLHSLHVFTGRKLVPVLASRTQIMLTLTDLAQQDLWATNVFARLVFAPTTV